MAEEEGEGTEGISKEWYLILCSLLLPLQGQTTSPATITDTVSQVKVLINKAFLESRTRYVRHAHSIPPFQGFLLITSTSRPAVTSQ